MLNDSFYKLNHAFHVYLHVEFDLQIPVDFFKKEAEIKRGAPLRDVGVQRARCSVWARRALFPVFIVLSKAGQVFLVFDSDITFEYIFCEAKKGVDLVSSLCTKFFATVHESFERLLLRNLVRDFILRDPLEQSLMLYLC